MQLISTSNMANSLSLSSSPLSKLALGITNQSPKKHCHVSSRVACTATKPSDDDHHDHEPPQLSSVARRNLLIGLGGGGLYGTLHRPDPFAVAAPITLSDLSTCGSPDLPKGAKPTNCCPPLSSNITDYTLPLNPRIRIRQAAHLADATFAENYKEAIRRMKALPSDDPRSFTQQANVHCAYCDGGYRQVGFPDLDIQVHNSWLFFPFHRWYLYFYERILASLIRDRDPNFALPFWNWDGEQGMAIPDMFSDSQSPLYDSLRNANHHVPVPVDLNYNGVDDKASREERVAANMNVMYRQLVSSSKTPSLFFGNAYRAGDASDPGAGSVENVPHGPVHVWTGDNTQPNLEDMGTLYSAARDPIFYSHHSNVDRLWEIWKTLGPNRTDISDPDWLESGFLFYDENKNLVRVKIKDCLDTKRLGYVYQDVEIPWVQAKPTPRRTKSSGFLKKLGVGAARAAEDGGFPVVLESSVSRIVKRVGKKKEEEEEVLVIEGIEFEREVGVKFDVYVNDEEAGDYGPGPIKTEFAGSFVSVAHKHKHRHNNKSGGKMKTNLRIGITELLEDLGADQDDHVVVTLVPRFGRGHVTVGNIKIQLHDSTSF